ncbi:MAG: aldo/keto reductase, partial [Propionibacteriales bacterium]|nr:aldo/keto reductase [Propionibacteriales bacterium]
MQTRRLGDAQVSAIGLGAMPLTTDRRPDEAQAIQTVHAALDAGVTLIDTADAYTPSDRGAGMNEEVVAKALSSYSGSTDDVIVATKGGHTRDGGDWGVNGRPDYLRSACEASLRRLGVESIGLYQHHRPDPDVPYAETMGGLKQLHDAGLIQRAGISNADPDQIRLAADVLGDALVSVQNQFSPKFRSSQPEIAV